jgi:hypothetical protein
MRPAQELANFAADDREGSRENQRIAPAGRSASGDQVTDVSHPESTEDTRHGEDRRHRPLRNNVLRVARAVFGTRLQAHIVVCGFPRSGTTLLHLMIQASVSDVRCFPVEYSALAAKLDWPMRQRQTFLLTKRPNDTLVMDLIRRRWTPERPVKFIFCVRDPRAVCTSRHANRAGARYYVTPERWCELYDVWERERHSSDVRTVEFATLVTRPDDVQTAVSTFTGWHDEAPFASAHTRVPKGFDPENALNGVRPPNPEAIHHWKRPDHAERIRELLQAIPDLPERLITMGYEVDDRWTERYR